MCLICIDFDRGALKPLDARRALGEMRATLDAAHVRELEQKLDHAEQASSSAQPQATVQNGSTPPAKP